MLPSTGHFKAINCPFYESGLCERPYCHFRHVRKDSDNNSEPLENGDILQQLVSEAVKKVLLQTETTSNDADSALKSQSIISKVVQEINPMPAPKVTYNPTPITELNKIMPSSSDFQPTPCKKEPHNRRHIPVPYTPHRPASSSVTRASAKPSTLTLLTIASPFSPAQISQEKYTPEAMESESSVKYLPGSVAQQKPTPYNPLDEQAEINTGVEYTPSDLNTIADLNVSGYSPTGQSMSGVSYSPGAPNSATHGTSTYCPKNTGYSVSGIGSMSPCYSSSISYKPTPLNKTLPPAFSSDEDEPTVKKAKLSDLDLDSEFELLGEILEDEETSIKPSDSETFNLISNSSAASKTRRKLNAPKSSDHKSQEINLKSNDKSFDASGGPKKANSSSSKHNKGSPKCQSSKSTSSKESCKNSSGLSSEKTSSKHSHSGKSRHSSSSSRKGDGRTISKDKDKSTDKKSHQSSSSSKYSSKSENLSSDTSKSKHSTSNNENRSKNSSDSKSTHCDSKSKSSSESKTKRSSSSTKSNHDSKSRKSTDNKGDHRDSKVKSDGSKRLDTSKSLSRSDRDSHKSRSSRDKPNASSDISSKSKTNVVEENKNNDQSASDNELIEEFSDADEETITQECMKIFEEYVPSVKEAVFQNISKQETIVDDSQLAGKKRVAHPTNQTIYRSTPTALPDHKSKAIQLSTERYSKAKQFHEARMQRSSLENSSTQFSSVHEDKPSVSFASSSSKVRIAHVPNVSTLLNAKKALKVPDTPKATPVQTISKGSTRVAHMPNDKFSERPSVLEPLASKIPVNIRSKYLNLMIDECLKIYLTPEDAYARAQQEELNTSKKCTAIQIYKNSSILAITRLRKEIQEAGGVKINQSDLRDGISHNKVLLGKRGETISWSIESKYKKETDSSQEFRGSRFYTNIAKWILTEQELQDNGFPRPHPDLKEKGAAKIYTKNTRQRPQKGYMRWCCRCKKEYLVDKKGVAVRKEECIYHPNNKYRFRGEVKYQCCGQDTSSDGCLSASCHVYEYSDHDNLRGFVTTLPKDIKPSECGVYALDCEMSYTTNGLDLTRVTVIDSNLSVVYESLVKPIHPVIDYNTRYSGITEEQMDGVTTTLLEVQATFLHMFSDKTILIGHSLESDFKALKLIHSTIIDTSVLFPHKMGPPYKRALRNLTSEYIKKIIQNNVEGHDSAEDATVCMELLIWKLKEELKTR